jgi:AcrR family transcriptional regulator
VIDRSVYFASTQIDCSVYFVAVLSRRALLAPMPSALPPASAKREHLLDTAWDLFCQNGYRAVGIDTVLARAGVAKMTLYHHFASKEDLIAAALEKKAGELTAALEAAVAAAGSNPRRRLLGAFDWLDAWVRSPDFTGCAYIKAAGEYGEADAKPRQAAAAFKRALQARLGALCAEAGLRQAPSLPRQLMLLMDGAAVQAQIHGDADYADEARAAAKALIEAHTR